MKLIIETIKDLTPVSLVTYTNKEGKIALGYNRTLGIYNGQEVTQEEADKWLASDVFVLHKAIGSLLTVKPNKNQERALISLIHDIGLDTFSKSELRRHFNNGNLMLASSEFKIYNTNGRAISVAVVRRRQIEQNIFNLGVE
jgi:GH24 family phage-related lysozyme (muramidase)